MQNNLISQYVEADKPVIPVLLPGVGRLPDELLFLRELHGVTFLNNLDDKSVLETFV